MDCMLGSPKSTPITRPPTHPTPKTGIGLHARQSQVCTHHAPTHKTGIGLHARQLSFEVPGKDVSITHPPIRLELDCMLGSPKSTPITQPPIRLELECMLGSSKSIYNVMNLPNKDFLLLLYFYLYPSPTHP